MRAEGAKEDERAAIYVLLDGQDTMGIGLMAEVGFQAICWKGWVTGWIDTPQTATTTRAPALLKKEKGVVLLIVPQVRHVGVSDLKPISNTRSAEYPFHLQMKRIFGKFCLLVEQQKQLLFLFWREITVQPNGHKLGVWLGTTGLSHQSLVFDTQRKQRNTNNNTKDVKRLLKKNIQERR